MSSCATCAAENQEELEELGRLALAGEISWRQASIKAGLTHHAGLKNHMEKHYVSPTARVEQEADDVLASLIADTLEELKASMQLAPVEIKPLYAVAIRNLAGLKETKPSQQHLIAALKSIHEITGMKMEQRLMLDFARAHFGQLDAPAPAPAALPSAAQPAALDAMRHVLDAEVVE